MTDSNDSSTVYAEVDAAASAASDALTKMLNETQGDPTKLGGIALAAAAAAGVAASVATGNSAVARNQMVEHLVGIMRRAAEVGRPAVVN